MIDQMNTEMFTLIIKFHVRIQCLHSYLAKYTRTNITHRYTFCLFALSSDLFTGFVHEMNEMKI